MLRRDYHNETVGILICGTKNDRSVRYSLGRSTPRTSAWPGSGNCLQAPASP